MTIHAYVDTFQGKPVVDFTAGDTVSGEDVVYRIRQEYDDKRPQIEHLDALLAQVDPGSLQALIIGAWDNSFEDGPDGYLNRLIERRQELTALRALFVGDMVGEDCEISWIIQTDYTPLLNAFPQLEVLRVRGSSSLTLQPLTHASLRELAIECGGLPLSIIEAIGASSFPALKRLELWLGDENYGYESSHAAYGDMLESIGPERLEYLGLCNAEDADELAKWLAQQPWLGQLRTLDLSMGTLSDEGAQALAASPYIQGLKRLNISFHYLSHDGEALLQELPCEVNLDDPQDADEYDGESHRYVAVSE